MTLLDPSCPWYALRSRGLPNIDWCEAELCSWITEPANTWSNLAYLLAAWIIWKEAKRDKSEIRFIAPAVFVMGLFSLIYHASCSFALQLFDFVGMYLFTGWLLALNLRRMGAVGAEGAKAALAATVIGGTALIFALRALGIPYQGIIGVLSAALVATEARTRMLKDEGIDYRWFLATLACFGVAGIFSFLDVSRIWCEPDNHLLQGHALWHLFGAAGTWTAYRHYRQAHFPTSAKPPE